MNILSIDSSTIYGSVSLFIENNHVETMITTQPRSQSIKLPVFVDEILKKYNFKVKDLDGIAISSGPGSYSGLRIGMSLAKGLAFSQEKPLIPVLTFNVIESLVKNNERHWVAIHSHRDIVYAQQFENGNMVDDPICKPISEIKVFPFFGVGLSQFKDQISLSEIIISSQNVGLLALEHFEDLVEHDLNNISPFYLSNFNVSNKQ